jgi:putative transposase
MIQTFQYKLYPNQAQSKTLERWLGVCCWVYNRALEHRKKAYLRRAEHTSYNDQQAMLTGWRTRMDSLRAVPCVFERDALRRVDRGMKAFFRRLKAGGEKPGFPRFRSRHRYNSLECLAVGKYLLGNHIRIPNLGKIRCRGRLLPDGIQRALRVICRASGWYAQILLDDGKTPPESLPADTAIGIDVGLNTFAALSDGTMIPNPRFGRKSAAKLRAVQRRVSRRVKGSNRRRKAVKALVRQHERIADQRKYFCHEHSTALVRQYALIGFENLNIKGMARTRFAKSIYDAAWGMFTAQIVSKAEWAGKRSVAVNPRRTSQECPWCGAIVKKKLSEREHRCPCGCTKNRDHASAQVILARALAESGATRPWRDPAADRQLVVASQAGPLKRVMPLALSKA